MIIAIVIVVLAAVIAVGAFICARMIINNREQKKYYDAAYKMIKEQYLDDALRLQGGAMNTQFLKTMVYLKNMRGKRDGFVFDPEQGIYLGRNVENTLCIRDLKVSGHHCRLFLYNGYLYVEDMGSSNGTRLKQGRKIEPVSGSMPVVSGDRILFGDQDFKVILFNFDTTVL